MADPGMVVEDRDVEGKRFEPEIQIFVFSEARSRHYFWVTV